MPDNSTKLAFISYASTDQQAAIRICGLIESKGAPCWMAPRDIPPGMTYPEAIVKAIDATKVLVLVLSDSANLSTHVASEVGTAFSKGNTIITIRLKDTKPGDNIRLFLTLPQWVDAWPEPLEAKMGDVAATILKSCDQVRVPPPPESSAPTTPAARGIRWLRIAGIAVLACLGIGAVFFVRSRLGPTPPDSLPPRPPETVHQEPVVVPADRDQLLLRALALGRSGDTNAALHLLASMPQGADRLTQVVADYLAQERRSKSHDALRDLIAQIEKQKAATKPTDNQPPPVMAKPRIIACLGPLARQGTAGSENEALLYRICLGSELRNCKGVKVIEREAIEQVLQEMNLGASSLADARAATTVGKLLPAGLLLLGDFLSMPAGDRVFLRLVDTESTRVVANFEAKRNATNDVTQVCHDLAARILDSATKTKPLAAPVARIEGQTLQAGIGSFHGADTGTVFQVIRRIPVEGAANAEFREQPIGTAKISRLGEMMSDLTADWTDASKPTAGDVLWLKEIFN